MFYKFNAPVKYTCVCCTQKVWTVVKSIFSTVFLCYISHCSALTHMFPQACNMLHRASSSSPLSLLSHILLAGWPNHLWQAAAFHAALWVCVCVRLGRSHCTKEQGHTGASSVRQAATVCSGCWGASHAVCLCVSAAAELSCCSRRWRWALMGAHQLPEEDHQTVRQTLFYLKTDE